MAVLGPLAGPGKLPGRNLDSAEQKKSGVRRLSAGRNRVSARLCMRPPPAGGATPTIAARAGRLGLDEREAIALATDCAAAGYVQLNVKGPPYAQSPEIGDADRQGLARNGQAVPSQRARARVVARLCPKPRSLSEQPH